MVKKLQPKTDPSLQKDILQVFFPLKGDILKRNLKQAFKKQIIILMGKVCALLCMCMPKSTSSLNVFPITTGNLEKDASVYRNSDRTL